MARSPRPLSPAEEIEALRTAKGLPALKHKIFSAPLVVAVLAGIAALIILLMATVWHASEPGNMQQGNGLLKADTLASSQPAPSEIPPPNPIVSTPNYRAIVPPDHYRPLKHPLKTRKEYKAEEAAKAARGELPAPSVTPTPEPSRTTSEGIPMIPQ